MDHVRLGRSGLKVSRLCLGCMSFGTPKWRNWVLDEAGSRPVIQAALEAGITFFDTADMYSAGVSEEVTGRALKDMARRDEIVLATKVFNPTGDKPTQRGLSRKHIMEAIDASLTRLGTDYVDLYITHRWDDEVPTEEVMEALDDVVKAGKALYIGASSMWAWQLAKALYVAEMNGLTRFVSMQNHYNLIYREEEREMIPLCRDQGIGLTPWSPLARGFLAGNRHRQGGGETARAKDDPMAQSMYYSDEDFRIADAVVEIARARGVKPIQVALAWILQQPGVSAPVIGVTRQDQLAELVAGTELRLSDEEVGRLQAPYRPKPVAGHA